MAGVGTGSAKQCTGTPLPCPALKNDRVTNPTRSDVAAIANAAGKLGTTTTTRRRRDRQCGAAHPRIALDVSPAASVWVVNAYQLALVMALLALASGLVSATWIDR